MPGSGTAEGVESLADLPGVIELVDGWAGLLRALSQHSGGVIDGAWGSAASLAAAALAKSTPGTLLIALAHPGDIDPWGNDLFSFTGVKPFVFPAWETWPPEKMMLDDVPGRRLRVLQKLATSPPKIVLATMSALMQPVPSKEELAGRGKLLKVGTTIDVDEMARWLVEQGYKRVDAVELPGEFSKRGGILDIYSPDADVPIRLELFGDEIESLRSFAAATQRSIEDLRAVTVLGTRNLSEAPRGTRAVLLDHFPANSWVAFVEPGDLREQAKFFLEAVSSTEGLFSVNGIFSLLMNLPNVTISAMPRPSVETSVHLRVESVERFSGNVSRVREELDAVAPSDRVLVACHNEAESHRLQQVLAAGKLAETQRLRLVTGSVRAGFRLVEAGIVVLGSHELFHREQAPAGEKAAPTGMPKRRIESRAIDSFLELNEGDLVVHVVQGIARYRGMKMLDRGVQGPGTNDESDKALDRLPGLETQPKEEHLLLEFRDGVLMYVPVSKIDLVQKYVGGSKSDPELSKLGGTAWGRKKERVEEAVRDLAADMIQLQAMRAAQPGIAFPADTEWMKEFEASFPYQETPDQLTAIVEIKGDLEKPRPMDRLLCGDVGYGKTEMAVRAVFKIIDAGKQAAVLVPTTILAEQHFRTFSQRLAPYPFVVDVVSRFRSPGEQKKVLKRVAEGAVDVIIGTHRLVSKDVRFKDLGIVIIDEEQRFGVEHKERLKQIRAMVHVLTMTATPIPRTLHLALLGIRDISNLETPPPERLPVETRIIRWDDKLIRAAILREFNRDGQVYFVHNRVHDIQVIANRIATIVPEATIVIGHGQMAEGELEQAMLKFVRKEANILVATTIIESGLDIPNANTIFIDQADHYGLADLHQLRGRVGRQKNRAYAYMLLDNERDVTPNAAKRLKAIEEFTELGSGFKIAMRDLEIRGAGNILGMEQSGHISSIGYELYCQLLENAVRTMKNLPLKTPLEVHVDLPWPAFLPRDYVPGQKLRMEVYRRLSRIRDARKIEDFRQELRDRYGPVPDAAEWLLKQTELRLLASRWQVASIHRNGPDIVLTYRSPKRIKQLAEKSLGRLKVVDEQSAYWRLQEGEEQPGQMYQFLLRLLSG
ncbi:MAG: transcription-repair coupling factor [Planctomycetes bacterium]|nr:transcription-repair coupling factor [Planctomycetota bacterium]